MYSKLCLPDKNPAWPYCVLRFCYHYFHVDKIGNIVILFCRHHQHQHQRQHPNYYCCRFIYSQKFLLYCMRFFISLFFYTHFNFFFWIEECLSFMIYLSLMDWITNASKTHLTSLAPLKNLFLFFLRQFSFRLFPLFYHSQFYTMR